MAKFFVDAFADMFEPELSNNNLSLAPTKLFLGKKEVIFDGWKRPPTTKMIEDIKKLKYSIGHITQEEWIEFFTPFLQAKEDVAFFSVSLQLYIDGGADLLAAITTLSEQFPNQKICVVDTKTVSRGTSNIAVLTSTLFKKNQNFDQAVEFATNLAGQFVTAFVVDDVKFLSTNPIMKKAGASLFGGLVGVKPIICIDKKGNFKLLDKSRGFKAGVEKLFSIVNTNGENIADFTFSIVFSNADTEALELKNKFLKVVDENEVTIIPSSLNNMCFAGVKFVGITFHSN